MNAADMERWFARELAEQPLEYPEALVKLIDALRDYVRSSVEIEAELVEQGSITDEQLISSRRHLKQVRTLLGELESWNVDETLCGAVGRQQA